MTDTVAGMELQCFPGPATIISSGRQSTSYMRNFWFQYSD